MAKKTKKEEWIKLNFGICENISKDKREKYLSDVYDRLVGSGTESNAAAAKDELSKSGSRNI